MKTTIMKNRLVFSIRFCLVIAFVLTTKFSFSQELSRKEKLESIKIAYITKELNLSSEEAKQFWPVYEEYKAKLDLNRKKFRKSMGKEKIDFVSDKEAENYLQLGLQMRQNEVEIHREYIEKFKKVISIKKVAKLAQAEESFKRELLEKVKSRK